MHGKIAHRNDSVETVPYYRQLKEACAAWWCGTCLLYTSDAADDLLCVDLGGRRIIKKKTI